MSSLTSKFGRGTQQLKQNTPLTNDQMLKIAPSIFAENPHESRSQRYTYIPTINIVNFMTRRNKPIQRYSFLLVIM